MAIPKKVEQAINKQINAELYSAYLYLSMQSYFDSINLAGFANWMRIQAMEEFSHADKFYHHVNERGGRAIMEAIDKPETQWKSPLDAFEAVYAHEQKVTALINGIAEIAENEKDRASLGMLQWFIDEQVEEEASADAIVQKLKLAKDSPEAIFMIDKELAARVFVPPTAAE